MIKLTQVLFEVTEETLSKIDRIKGAFEDALNEYDQEMIRYEANPYGEAPAAPKEPKPYKLKETDYKRTEAKLFLKKEDISFITQDLTGETIVVTRYGKELTIKATPEEVYELVNN